MDGLLVITGFTGIAMTWIILVVFAYHIDKINEKLDRNFPQPDNEGTGATPSSPGKIEKDSPVWRGIVGLSRRK